MSELLGIAVESAVDRDALKAAIENGKDQLAAGPLGALSWPLVKDKIADALDEKLGAGLLGWIAHGWSAARELKSLKATAKPGERMFLKLGKHKLSGNLKPVVKIALGAAEVATLAFDMPLTAAINATSLVVRDGRIIGLGGGTCEITLEILYQGANLSGDLPLKTIELPGSYPFDPGIAIP